MEAVKEEPRDDAEVERKEEAGIDQAFAESSSSEEDEDLTEHGTFFCCCLGKTEEEIICTFLAVVQARS